MLVTAAYVCVVPLNIYLMPHAFRNSLLISTVSFLGRSHCAIYQLEIVVKSIVRCLPQDVQF